MGRLRVTLGRPTNRSTARQGRVKNDTFTHNDRSELVSATLGTDAYSYSEDKAPDGRKGDWTNAQHLPRRGEGAMGCARVNIGNRKTAQEAAEEATAYDANSLNQYTAIQEGTAEAFVPTFDADGNQIKVQTSTGIWNVVYNAENRPVTFTSEDGATVVECTYDYMGRRHTRKITVNGSVTNYLRYIYRGYLQIAAINAVSGVFQWFILWDPTQSVATRPLGIRKDGTWYTYGWDLTKNICEVFGSDGYIKTAYTYTPYGSVTANGNVTQPIQWSSEYNDSELGLVYYNYRHYLQDAGRWIGRDRSESNTTSLNRYGYCSNSPDVLLDYVGKDIYHVLDPDGANKYGHSMYVIGNDKDGYNVYSYCPDHSDPSKKASSLSHNFATSPNYGGKPYAEDIRTLAGAMACLATIEGESDPSKWVTQQWVTSRDEDRRAKQVANEYVKKDYYLLWHNCYTLIKRVFEVLNKERRKRGQNLLMTYQGIGPKKSFIINEDRGYAKRNDKAFTGRPGSRRNQTSK